MKAAPWLLAMIAWVGVGLGAGVGCSKNEGSGPGPGPGARDAGSPPADAGFTPDAAGPDDAGVLEPDAGFVPPVCRELGLAALPMKPAAATYNFGDVAGDFTVHTLSGETWSLGEQWTGCESYTFLGYIPTQSDFEERLWASSPEVLVSGTALNAHFFFVSWEQDEAARRQRVQRIWDLVDSYIEVRIATEGERNAQRARFHYVVDAPQEIQGSAGEFLRSYMAYSRDPASVVDLGDRGQAAPPLPFTFAIDRDQEWDAGENLSQYVGGAPAFKMASYLPAFFDHKAKIRDRQSAETGVESFVLLAGRQTDRTFQREVALPDAARMRTFDTLEFDVTITCPERNVFNCSEWDRIARIALCLDAACMDRRELVRWITPYWRRGEQRWVMDASSLLGLLSGGGMRRFFIEAGPDWERPTSYDARVVLRLSNVLRGQRAVEALPAFSGGAFNANYNMRQPFRFTPPAGARRVELVAILSGHGQDGTTNCAEWCDHRHRFSVNGNDLQEIRHEGMIGSIAGCGRAAALGAPPGQWGNWAPERAYWCPGLPVDHIRIDITDYTNLGAENTLGYSASLAGRTPQGGDIDLSTYVVWYE